MLLMQNAQQRAKTQTTTTKADETTKKTNRDRYKRAIQEGGGDWGAEVAGARGNSTAHMKEKPKGKAQKERQNAATATATAQQQQKQKQKKKQEMEMEKLKQLLGDSAQWGQMANNIEKVIYVNNNKLMVYQFVCLKA